MAEEKKQGTLLESHPDICAEVGAKVLLTANNYNGRQHTDDNDFGAQINQLGLLLFGIAQAGIGQVVERERQAKRQLAKANPVPLDTPIEVLSTTIRTYYRLKENNIKTLGDIINLTERQYLGFKNAGRKSLNEIKELVEACGYTLKEEV